jgi:cytochrome c peroxidase
LPDVSTTTLIDLSHLRPRRPDVIVATGTQAAQAAQRVTKTDNQARMQVPTLRNVDKRPYPEFVKAYGHNGYFTSLRAFLQYARCPAALPAQ